MLKDLVKKNRSYRGYDESRNISHEELMDMVDLARITASMMNKQPLEYYITNDEGELSILLENTVFGAALKELGLPREGSRPRAFILILQDKEKFPNLEASLRDVGIAEQTILLRAVELGLGGLIIGSYSSEKIKGLLGLEDKYQIQQVIAIGKPKEEIVLVDVDADASMTYYRDENDVHYVPKRKLSDIVKHK